MEEKEKREKEAVLVEEAGFDVAEGEASGRRDRVAEKNEAFTEKRKDIIVILHYHYWDSAISFKDRASRIL